MNVLAAWCPGPTQTRFPDAAQMKNSRLFRLNTMSASAVRIQPVRE
jgi:hypothetical protein